MRIDADHRQYLGSDLEAMSAATNYYRWIVRQWRPWLGPKVAEVGAGSGNFSQFLLAEKPADFLAVEPSENMFPRLHARLGERPGVRLHHGFLSQLPDLAGEARDAIVYCNVMEHVQDDEAEVRLAFQALRPGGHLLIWVPALPALMSRYDRDLGHFRRYTQPTLRRLVEGAGFRIERCHYYDFLGIAPWWLMFTVLGRTLGPGGVSAYDRWVVPWSTAIEQRLAPPIGKNLLLVATRPL